MLLSHIVFLHFNYKYIVTAGITTLVSAVEESHRKEKCEAEILETACCSERTKECRKEKSGRKKESRKPNIFCRHLSIT